MANIGPPNLGGQVLGLILRGGPPRGWRHFGYIDASGQIESGTTVTLPRAADGGIYGRATRQGATVLVEPSDGADESVDVGRVEPDGTVRDLTTIDGLQDAKVLGWTAPDTVLVLRTAELGGRRHTLALYNVTDGRLTELGSAAGAGGVDYTNSGGTPYLQLATDLLRRPMVNGVHPRSLDPRIRLALLAGGSIFFLTAGAGALIWWRRRA